jgi:hypothetical protein
MSITFQLSANVPLSSMNVSNVNGCALLRPDGLPPTEFGEVPSAEVGVAITNLFRAANAEDLQCQAVQCDRIDPSGHWCDLGAV